MQSNLNKWSIKITVTDHWSATITQTISPAKFNIWSKFLKSYFFSLYNLIHACKNTLFWDSLISMQSALLEYASFTCITYTTTILTRNLIIMKSWMDDWMGKLELSKCRVIDLSRKTNHNTSGKGSYEKWNLKTFIVTTQIISSLSIIKIVQGLDYYTNTRMSKVHYLENKYNLKLIILLMIIKMLMMISMKIIIIIMIMINRTYWRC